VFRVAIDEKEWKRRLCSVCIVVHVYMHEYEREKPRKECY